MSAPTAGRKPLRLLRSQRRGPPLASGHRGALEEAPENTLPSFELACSLEADLVEFDVQQTADGGLVIIHDDTLDRTTSGRGLVSERTLDEIRRLDAGAWFSPGFAGTRVPLLSEVLQLLRGRTYPIIELKQSPAGGRPSLVEPVARAIEEAGLVDQVLVLSFDHPSLLAMKSRLPAVRTAITYEGRLADPVAAARAASADVVWPSSEFLLSEDVDALHDAGLAVGCEAQRLEGIRKFLEWGVDFVEMNDLRSLMTFLAGRAPHAGEPPSGS